MCSLKGDKSILMSLVLVNSFKAVLRKTGYTTVTPLKPHSMTKTRALGTIGKPARGRPAKCNGTLLAMSLRMISCAGRTVIVTLSFIKEDRFFFDETHFSDCEMMKGGLESWPLSLLPTELWWCPDHADNHTLCSPGASQHLEEEARTRLIRITCGHQRVGGGQILLLGSATRQLLSPSSL